MGTLLHRFYTAFATGDHATMGACYHPEARFRDPVFPDLNAAEVKAMWKMLLTRSTDLRIEFTVLDETATSGTVRWEAWYTFSRTGRSVHNVVASTFMLRDGLIVDQRDRFSFWRWSLQALGATGLLLGWTPFVRDKVRATAAAGLTKTTAEG